MWLPNRDCACIVIPSGQCQLPFSRATEIPETDREPPNSRSSSVSSSVACLVESAESDLMGAFELAVVDGIRSTSDGNGRSRSVAFGGLQKGVFVVYKEPSGCRSCCGGSMACDVELH